MSDLSNAANPVGIRQVGSILIDGREVANTVECCHCNGHFLFTRGSGVRRGWCQRCMRMTCGNPACDPCRPWEQQMEEIERKASLHARLGLV